MLSIAAIAGISVGSLIAFALILNITCYLIKKKRLERQKQEE